MQINRGGGIMKKRKIVNWILTMGIVLTLLASSSLVYATSTKTEMQNKKDDVNSKINSTKKEIGDVQDDLSDGLKEVQKIDDQINTYQDQIDDLNDELDDLQDQIKEQEEELKKAEEKYQEQDDSMQKRLVVMYEAGQTSYLDVLLNSESVSDFISRYYLISEIAKYDSNLLSDLENSKKDIENKKKQLENTKSQIDAKKKSKQETTSALADKKELKNKQVSVLSSKEKDLQKQLDELEQDKRDIQDELTKIIKQEEAKKNSKKNNTTTNKPSNNGGSTSGNTGNDSSGSASFHGYIFPIAGLSKSNIRNKNYPSYTGHTGVDINIGVSGKTVRAVKGGTVVISEAKRNSDGSYRSYGEYIVIDHGDGTMTLYAHGRAGSRLVSKGQEVSQGQAIMTVGSTGNSTGEHLHFEVRVNARPVNPLPYLP